MPIVFLNSYVYENFELYSPLIPVNTLLWALIIGLGVGAVASFFQRRANAALVEAIARARAVTPESAKTLSELGLEKHPLVRLSLGDGKRMRRTVLCANEADFPPKSVPAGGAKAKLMRFFSLTPDDTPVTDLRIARFFIPEENRIAAEVRYDRSGTGVPQLILSLVLIVLAGLAAQYLLPELMTMLDNFLTMIEQ